LSVVNDNQQAELEAQKRELTKLLDANKMKEDELERKTKHVE
jgi:peptidoglycan hydrolase CwlO-like protein